MCATHFIGDGLALHQMGNDFFSLLGSTKTVAQLEEDLAHEWRLRCVKQVRLAVMCTLQRSLVAGFRPLYFLMPWRQFFRQRISFAKLPTSLPSRGTRKNK